MGLEADAPSRLCGDPGQDPKSGLIALVPLGLQKQGAIRTQAGSVHCGPIHVAAVEHHHFEFVGQGVDVGAARFEFLWAEGDPIPTPREGVRSAGFDVGLEASLVQGLSQGGEVVHGGLATGDDHDFSPTVNGGRDNVLNALFWVGIHIPALFDVAPDTTDVTSAEP